MSSRTHQDRILKSMAERSRKHDQAIHDLASRSTAGIFMGVRTVLSHDRITAYDGVVYVRTSSGSVTLTLPPARDHGGRIYAVKDLGDADENPITLKPTGADTIDGALSFTMDREYGSLLIQSDGRDWYTVTAPGSATTTVPYDHGGLSGLNDDDHTHYVHNEQARTITAQHTFSPLDPGAPFLLGENAQGQLVTGLNADLVDGLHASADPGQSAAVLATDAAGLATIYDATITNQLATPTITNSGNVTLSPTGDVVLAPGGDDVLPGTPYTVNLGLINQKYLTLHAAELWVETLVAQNTIATIGGRILVGPTTTLEADLNNTVDPVFTVKHNQMGVGDIAYMEAGGNVEFVEIGTVPITAVDTGNNEFAFTITPLAKATRFVALLTAGTKFKISGSTGNDGVWTVASDATRNVFVITVSVEESITDSTADGGAVWAAPSEEGPFSYANVLRNQDGSGGNLWYAGDAIFNMGQEGDGWIDLYSLQGVLSQGVGPTIVGNVRTGAAYNDYAEHWAIGNLNGLYDYGVDTYGVAFGAFEVGNYLTIDSGNGIRFYDSDKTLRAELDDDAWTLGNTATEHVQITPTSVNINDGSTVLTSISAGVVNIGNTSTEHVRITSTAVAIRDGSTVLTNISGGIVDIGDTSTEHIRITSTTVAIRDGSVSYATLSGNSFVIGRVANNHTRAIIDPDNGFRIVHRNGSGTDSTKIQFNSSGDGTLAGSLEVTGSITAASGDVVIDDDGITLNAIAGKFSGGSIDWVTGGDIYFSIGTDVDLGEMTVAYIDVLETRSLSISALSVIISGDTSVTGTIGASGNITSSGGDIKAASGLVAGSSSLSAGDGEVLYTGNLIARRGGSNYTGYIFIPFTTALTSTSWDGDAKVQTNGTAIELSSAFGLAALANAKALALKLTIMDTVAGSSGSVGPAAGHGAVQCVTTAGGYVSSSGIVPVAGSGNEITFFSTGQLDEVFIQIFGYFV